jgi:hypothetical protein
MSEAFTSPAFPGRSLDIKDQRARITRGERGYRSAEDPAKFTLPFTKKTLVRMLRAVFA